MRVIAGSCKGRPLKSVPGKTTRPTTDKVKEAMFNMIGPYFEGGIGLDLFGGSGSLGIEALSRGLDKVIFVDKDSKAIETIKQNVEQCNVTKKAEIYRNDANRALKALSKRDIIFSFIFLDPPYKISELEALIEKLDRLELLSSDGKIIVEHGMERILPETIGSLSKIRSETYGSTIGISIFEKG